MILFHDFHENVWKIAHCLLRGGGGGGGEGKFLFFFTRIVVLIVIIIDTRIQMTNRPL